MFKTRLLSGIVLMIITIALMIFGGLPLFWVITLITVIGLFELYRAVKMEKTVPALIGYAASIGLDLLLAAQKTDYVIMLLIGALMLMMACYVIAYPKYCSEQIIMVFFGLIYVTMMLSYVFQVRMLEGGKLIVWLIFIGAWGSDTCAYCVGKLIGKHKMPSKLSPNKTIEGCVGGIYWCSFDRLFVCTGFLPHPDRIVVAVCSGWCSILCYFTDWRSDSICDQEKSRH